MCILVHVYMDIHACEYGYVHVCVHLYLDMFESGVVCMCAHVHMGTRVRV